MPRSSSPTHMIAITVRRSAACALLAACALGAFTEGPALAQAQEQGSEVDDQTRAGARRMAEEAADLFDQKQFDKAWDLFHRAYKLVPAPTLLVWEARCLVELGKLVQAEERYVDALRTEINDDSPQLFRDAVAEAEAEIAKLRRRIPTVKIALTGLEPGDTADVLIDGKRVAPELIGVAVPVNPGKRVIAVSVGFKEVARKVIKVKEQQHQSVELDVSGTTVTRRAEDADDPEVEPEPLRPRPPVHDEPPPDDYSRNSVQYSLGSFAVGLGAIGLGTGLVGGLIAVNKNKSLRENCPDGECPPEYHADLRTFRTARFVSTIGYAVGAVGLLGGGVLMLTAPDDAEYDSASLGVYVSPSSAGILGQF